MTTMLRLALAAFLLLGATVAFPQDGDDFRFKLVNSSAVSVISFTTQRKNGSWSGNWIQGIIKPAEARRLVFNEGDDRCEIATRIVFSDGNKFDTNVNYCGITLVIATDETLYSR